MHSTDRLEMKNKRGAWTKLQTGLEEGSPGLAQKPWRPQPRERRFQEPRVVHSPFWSCDTDALAKHSKPRVHYQALELASYSSPTPPRALCGKALGVFAE